MFCCNLWLCCSNPGQVKTAQREGASPLMSAHLPSPKKVEVCFCLLQTKPRSFPRVTLCSAGSVCKVQPARSPGKKIPADIALAAHKALHCSMPGSSSPQKCFPQAEVPGLCPCWCLLFSQEMPRAGNHHHSTHNLPELVPPRVTVDQPWPFQLLRRFWAAWDSLVVIVQERKGKWSSQAWLGLSQAGFTNGARGG